MGDVLEPKGLAEAINSTANSTFANATCVYVVNGNTTTPAFVQVGPNTSNPTVSFVIPPAAYIRVQKLPSEVVSANSTQPASLFGTKVSFSE